MDIYTLIEKYTEQLELDTNRITRFERSEAFEDLERALGCVEMLQVVISDLKKLINNYL